MPALFQTFVANASVHVEVLQGIRMHVSHPVQTSFHVNVVQESQEVLAIT